MAWKNNAYFTNLKLNKQIHTKDLRKYQAFLKHVMFNNKQEMLVIIVMKDIAKWWQSRELNIISHFRNPPYASS